MKYEESMMASFGKVVRLHFIRTHAMMEKIGLYPGQHPLLFILREEPDGLSQKEIAARMSVKPATIAVMIHRMEKSGYVVRKHDETDRRVSRVFITDSGRKIVDQLAKDRIQLEEECFQGFSEQEMAQFQAMLDRVAKNLQAVTGLEQTKAVREHRIHSGRGGRKCHS